MTHEEVVARIEAQLRIVPWLHSLHSPASPEELERWAKAHTGHFLPGDNGYAELVRVATGNGIKEWLFYATDPEVFGENFNRVLEGHPRYPVSVEFEEDPAWHE